jgi:hypothetical protein
MWCERSMLIVLDLCRGQRLYSISSLDGPGRTGLLFDVNNGPERPGIVAHYYHYLTYY